MIKTEFYKETVENKDAVVLHLDLAKDRIDWAAMTNFLIHHFGMGK